MTTPLKVRIGAVAWCVFAYFSVPDLQHDLWANALLLLAVLVLVPMAWCMACDDTDAGWTLRLRKTAMVLQLPGGLLLGIALLLPQGPRAMWCALPWVVALGCMAIVGMLRILRRRLVPLADLVRDAGLIFALVGGVWVFGDRAGLQPLGLDRMIVIITAVHFHYAGLVLPVVAGLGIAKRPDSRVGQLAGWGVLIGVPLVAVGITATQLGWGRGIEMASTAVLVLACWGVALLHFNLVATEKTSSRATRMFWLVAAVALALGMVLAGLYGFRGLLPTMAWLDIPWMRALHGTLNSMGFGMAALLGWCRAGRCWPA